MAVRCCRAFLLISSAFSRSLKAPTRADPEVKMSFPDLLAITPLQKAPDAEVRVPGSKSITNRALVLGALSSRQGPCVLEDALQSEDTELMVAALQNLGFTLKPAWPRVEVSKHEGPLIPAESAD